MYDIIYSNLERRGHAFALLLDLLHEEYQNLCDRNTDAIMALEMSIQELLRQLAGEKQEVKTLIGGGKLKDYAAMLPAEEGAALMGLWKKADRLEQECARQSGRNSQLSLALFDASKEALDFFYARAVPPKQETYGRAGGYVQQRSEAVIVSGRL